MRLRRAVVYATAGMRASYEGACSGPPGATETAGVLGHRGLGGVGLGAGGGAIVVEDLRRVLEAMAGDRRAGVGQHGGGGTRGARA